MTDKPSARDVIAQALFDDGFGGTSDPDITDMFAEVCKHNADVALAALRAAGYVIGTVDEVVSPDTAHPATPPSRAKP